MPRCKKRRYYVHVSRETGKILDVVVSGQGAVYVKDVANTLVYVVEETTLIAAVRAARSICICGKCIPCKRRSTLSEAKNDEPEEPPEPRRKPGPKRKKYVPHTTSPIEVLTEEKGPCVRCGSPARMRRVRTSGTLKPFTGMICTPCAEALIATEQEEYREEGAGLFYTNHSTGNLTPASIGNYEE